VKKTDDKPIAKKLEEKKPVPQKEMPEEIIVPDNSFDRSPPRGGGVIPIPNARFDENGKPLDPDDYPENLDELELKKMPDVTFTLHPASKGKRSSVFYFMLEEKADLLLIEFWSMNNEQSKRELPYLEYLSSDFRDSIQVLGVSVDPADSKPEKKMDEVLKNDTSMEKSWSELGKYAKVAGSFLTFPIVVDGAEMAKQFSITTYPTTLVVTKDLRLYHKFEGFGIDKMNDLQGKIMKYLIRNGTYN
jgi:thiol-disulfide isomerase/thioredoxin